MHPDRGHHFVAFRVDDADVVGLGVYDVHLVLLRIDRRAGRVLSNLDGFDVLEISEIENGDSVALAVRDVSELVIPSGVGDGLATASAKAAEQDDHTNGEGRT